MQEEIVEASSWAQGGESESQRWLSGESQIINNETLTAVPEQEYGDQPWRQFMNRIVLSV